MQETARFCRCWLLELKTNPVGVGIFGVEPAPCREQLDMKIKEETTMEYGVFSANGWLYPDTDPGEGKRRIELTAAGNSAGSAQVLIRCDEPLFWEWSTQGMQPLTAPEVYRLLPVFVEKNTGERGFTVEQGTVAEYACRPAPFWVYDAMEPVEEILASPKEDGVLGLYLRWPTKQMAPGVYRGCFRLRRQKEAQGPAAEIAVCLRVAATAVPEEETLRLTNWYSLENMATYHGAEPWSEEHWERIADYGRLMREGRQTDFTVSPGLADYMRREDGRYVFDFSRTERFIRLYLSLGFRYIEGETPIFREDWAAKTFVVGIGGKRFPALSQEAYAFLQGYFTGWYTLLKANGWLKQTIQHVGDEPHTECAAEYRILSGMVRKWMPGVPIIEAVECPELDGAVDIWVPKDNSYMEQPDAYERKRWLGDTLWYYTCCCPGGRYLNRLLDEELLRTRYLHWANRLYDMPGYLHWGLNHYECTNDPFEGRAGSIETLSTTALPCGDSHLVYPLGKQVLRSVRFEMMRAGCEDYELLGLLAKHSPEKADELMKRCVRSFTDYTTDVSVFEQVYSELLDVDS